MTDSIIQRRRLPVILWLLAILLGLLYTWRAFYDPIDPDSISYLEMGEAFLRRDWQMAINAYWSPFYPWLLAAALYVLHPPLPWQFAVVPLVDFAVYLGMLGCFHFFVREVLRLHRAKGAEGSSPRPVMLPEWVVCVVAYTLFMWISLEWLGSFVSPADRCVAAFVYVAAGLLLRMRSASKNWWTFILFGVVLGGGYLAKAAMFPLAFIFLASSIFSGGPFRQMVWRGLAAFIAFLVIASPWILALSQAKGYLTAGLSGKLNYAWMVNGVTRHIHWQGEPPDSGTPRHPTRKIFDRPAVYEFATPIGESYPPWYDPTYWYEGLTTSFDLKEQMHALFRNIGAFLRISPLAQGGLMTGFLILFMMAGTPWHRVKDIAKQWHILLPAIVALGMYALVRIEARYVAPFVMLFWIGLLSSVRLEDAPKSQRLLAGITLAMLLPMMGTIGAVAAERGYSALRYAIRKDSPAHIQWYVAEFLHRIGVQPGDKVASVGRTFDANWAHLTQVQIVAEIPHRDENDFWAASDAVRSQALSAFGKTGAKLIVADRAPGIASTLGWERIGHTGHYVYVLPAAGDGLRVIRGGVSPARN
jgi:4-amino-4-deoxy-L-arabinose transferase-like glycosyltransferase